MNRELFKATAEKSDKIKNIGTISIIIFMLAALMVKCIFTVWGGNYLYADGANFCYGILRDNGGMQAFDGRQGSFFLMKLFITLALKLGITDIKILCGMFGLGSVIWLALFSLLAMILCKLKGKDQFIIGIAILYAMVNIFTGFFTQIESITSIGIFTYLLVYYMLSERRDWFFRIIAVLLLPLMHNANEYFVGFAVILAVVLLTRIVRERDVIYISEYVCHLGVSIYTAYTSYLAATQGASTSSLAKSIEGLPARRYYWLLIGLMLLTFVFAVFFCVLLKGKGKLLVWLPACLTCIWLGMTAVGQTTLVATQSFSMRFMNFVLPCGFGVIFYILWILHWDIQSSALSLMAAVFLVINSVYVVQSAGEYRDYLEQLNSVCEERRGFFELRSTDIDATYTWGWPLPMESVLAQCLAGRSSIWAITIKDFNASYWEAFDSDDINAYADFQRYGVIIDKESFL